jgi:hypothetical protein
MTSQSQSQPLTKEEFLEQVVEPSLEGKYYLVLGAIETEDYKKAFRFLKTQCTFCSYHDSRDYEYCNKCLIVSVCLNGHPSKAYGKLYLELKRDNPNQQRCLNYTNAIITAIKEAGERYGEEEG